jgi:hypothetical protein
VSLRLVYAFVQDGVVMDGPYEGTTRYSFTIAR